MSSVLSSQTLRFANISETVELTTRHEGKEQVIDKYTLPNDLGTIEVSNHSFVTGLEPHNHSLQVRIDANVPKAIKDSILKSFSGCALAPIPSNHGQGIQVCDIAHITTHAALSNAVHQAISTALKAEPNALKSSPKTMQSASTSMGAMLSPEQKNLLSAMTAIQGDGDLQAHETAAISHWLRTLQQSSAAKKAGLNVSFTIG